MPQTIWRSLALLEQVKVDVDEVDGAPRAEVTELARFLVA